MNRTIPTPIVSWEDVVAQSDPLHAPSRQRLRSVRAKSKLSDGVQIVRRANGRAAGSAVYYSSLTALGVRAQTVGSFRAAEELTQAGADIEKWVSPALGQFLTNHAAIDLPLASFWRELIERTSDALQHITLDFVVLRGSVAEIHGNTVRIVDDSGDDSVMADLPVEVMASAHTSDHVWVMRQVQGSATVLTVLPAVSTEESDAGERYWTTGPGAPISDAEASYFANLQPGALPKVRILRPAG